ncbi:MAG: acetyltransferase [Alphaproteobacteria bacterium]
MRLWIFGVGAQAKYAADTARLLGHYASITILRFPKDTVTDWPGSYGAQVRDAAVCMPDCGAEDVHCVVAQAKPADKKHLFEQLIAAGARMPTLAHPSAIIASSVKVGDGCIINANAVIQPLATVGRGVMIHAQVSIDHDAIIGDYANLAPGATLAGWVKVGEGATVFTSAAVTPGVTIGAGAVVGAGAVATKDVAPGVTVVGVPAKAIN